MPALVAFTVSFINSLVLRSYGAPFHVALIMAMVIGLGLAIVTISTKIK